MNNNMKQLLKLLLGAGLVLVDSGRREKAVDNIRDRVDDLTGSAKEKYDDAVERLERISDSLRGKERWTSKAGSFALGVGVGVGLGVLLAPASGAETRNSIAQQASDVRDRVSEQARNLKDRVRVSVSRESAPVSGENAERMPRPA